MCVTTPSTWPWIDHLVSGLRLTTKSLYSNSLSLRLPYTVKLAIKRKSLTHYAKGTQSPLTRLLLFVCMRFQDLFHSPPGVLFTFPSRYFFTIAHSYLFSLGGWSRLLPTRFLVSRRTQETLTTQFAYLYGNFTLFVCAFHHILVHLPFVSRVPTTPYFYGLGSFPFARRY